MRIIRFMDVQGRIAYGTKENEGEAEVLQGDPFVAPASGPGSGLKPTGERRKVAKLLAPLDPRAILCIGLNYRKHAEETGAKIPQYPVLFAKNPAALNNPGDPIVIPPICDNEPQVDWEAELAVVIGKAAKDVSEADALQHVFGYTCGNDVSARWWQKTGGGGQFVRGKSFDGFCPLGPALVTADEIADPQTLAISCDVNGVRMQEDSTAGMLFSVAKLVAELSRGLTLLPGTVIMTGTPSGVGTARKPPVYLKAGDTVSVTIEGIGTLMNPVSGA